MLIMMLIDGDVMVLTDGAGAGAGAGAGYDVADDHDYHYDS